MKQAMIVLTLWVLSQNAYSQSVKLEGYSRDAMFVSSDRPNTLINRQPMAEIPHSILSKTEAPAAPALQKNRTAGAMDKTSSQEEVKALWANTKALEENTKALEENTKALEENTKALKENTEMMRRLLESGQYSYAGVMGKEQSGEKRLLASVVLSDHPAAPVPLFASDPLSTSIPAPASVTVVKPQPVMASATLRPAPYKIPALKAEQIKQAPTAKNTPVKINVVPAMAAVNNEKPQLPVVKNIPMKPSIPSASTAIKMLSAPRICYLNGSSIPSENTNSNMPAAKSSAPKAWAANTAIKMQAPKTAAVQKIAMPQSHTSPQIPVSVAVNTTIKPQPKGITPIAGPKMPLASAMTKAPSIAHLPASPKAANIAANQEASTPVTTIVASRIKPASPVAKTIEQPAHLAQPKAIAPIAGPKMLLASAMTKAPSHTNVPANPIPAKTAINNKVPTANNTLKPQVANVLIPVVAVKPSVSYTHAKESPAGLPPIMVTAPKPRAASASHNGPKNVFAAKSSMSVAIETGIIGKKNKKVSLGYLLQFPLLERSYDNQLRTAGHMPADVYSGFKEGDMVTTHGYISLIAIEDSGKQNETYYIQLVVNPYKKDSCLNIRITADQFAGDARKRLTENARQFVREQLLSGRNPSHSGNVMQSPVFVSITGQLVYNSALAGAMRGPHPLYIGKKGVRSYTPWEISNVNRIQFTR